MMHENDGFSDVCVSLTNSALDLDNATQGCEDTTYRFCHVVLQALRPGAVTLSDVRIAHDAHIDMHHSK
eukprot:COSAG06_NODE_1519_length_9208_cov_3.443957_14_plen_69_part_00